MDHLIDWINTWVVAPIGLGWLITIWLVSVIVCVIYYVREWSIDYSWDKSKMSESERKWFFVFCGLKLVAITILAPIFCAAVGLMLIFYGLTVIAGDA